MIACINGCDRIARARGICAACDVKFREAVRKGKTTWAKLQRQGNILPSKRRQAKP